MKSNEQPGYVLTLSEENFSLVIDALSYYAFVSVKDSIRDAAQKLHDDLFEMKRMIELENLDSHNCREDMNEYGYCTTCGAIVKGTLADYSEHGYDPPEDPWGL